MLGLKVGDTFTVFRRFLENDMRAFGTLTRDYNPIHYDDRFASAKGFRGRICHGLLIASLITEIGGQIGWLASGMNFRFIKPVYFGDTVTCVMTIRDITATRKARAEAVYENQAGDVVLKAELFGMLPSEADFHVLKTMAAAGEPSNADP
jgi:acyl dehydratase